MQSVSSYFEALLDPRRGFAESNALSAEQCNKTHCIALAMPHDVALSLGRNERSQKHLALCQMLRVLHMTDSSHEPLFYTQADLAFFLALAVDRYMIANPHIVNDSTQEIIGQSGKRLRNCFYKADWKESHSWSIKDEASCRKLVYSQQRLGLTNKMALVTRKLIVMGSDTHKNWFQDDGRTWDSVIWSLPAGLEEEIFTRRRAVLRKISNCIDTSLQKYASSLLQCRFGYGNSQACDTFQYGQTVRFLGRKGFMDTTIGSTISGSDDLNPMYTSSLIALIKELRAMPSYQIDAYHQHCGIKKDIVPVLDRIESLLAKDDCIGICGICWQVNQGSTTWQSTVEAESRMGFSACLKRNLHKQASDFFLE